MSDARTITEAETRQLLANRPTWMLLTILEVTEATRDDFARAGNDLGVLATVQTIDWTFDELLSRLPAQIRDAVTISRDPRSCWICQPHRKAVYASFQWEGRELRAHRLVFELLRGPIPPGLFVLHRCDVPKCVNPLHLFLGTKGENNADRDAKGRQAKGEQNGRSKLTPRQVAEIRRRYREGGISLRKLGAEYGLGHTTVRHIVTGRLWKDAPTATEPPRCDHIFNPVEGCPGCRTRADEIHEHYARTGHTDSGD